MKRLFLFALFICMTTIGFGQVPPNAFNYSAVARGPQGQPISSQNIGIRFSILKTTATGPVQYVESHQTTTDPFGLFNLIIGGGSVESGDFASIDWGADDYFLKVELDAQGNTNYYHMGTTQFLSVPYALSADNSTYSQNGIDSVSSTGDTLYLSNGDLFVNSSYFSGDYNDLTNQPENLSSFINDAGFISTDNDQQSLTVSQIGDTLYISNGNWVIVPGISSANYLFTPGDGTIDGSGNTYSSIIIGSQEWMEYNLRTTKYANGDDIPGDGIGPSSLWCSINQDVSNDIPYGKSYKFDVILDVRNVCPTGWYVPSNHDWNVLIKHIDSQADTTTENNSNLGLVIQSQTAGNLLKSNTFWNGTNESGFHAVAAGFSWDNFSFGGFGTTGYYWTSDVTDFPSDYNPCGFPCAAWMRKFYTDDSVEKSMEDQGLGHSIKCIKD
ncbi:fibrobacter succinogenes major paralogous domain-containing protein [Crocinitomicaceae bacterium]|nr:fibrobacter succinogenes major paralogous domain-containing protein [Crocinitomicaceae bacterium]